MKINSRQLLTKAKRNRCAIAAFNISSLEAVSAIMCAASELNTPVIIETSRGESEYLGPELIAKVVEHLAKQYGVDYVLHLDRSQTYDWIKRCLDAGYNSVTAESSDPDIKMSVEATCRIMELARKYNASVEGALEVVPLRYYSGQNKKVLLSSPQELVNFQKTTGVDSLVVSIGTQSGAKKRIENINFEILKQVNKLLPEVPFVLHGGSFLEESLVKTLINNGISKVNVNSELRLAYSIKLKANLKLKPNEYAPYRLLEGIEEEIKQVAVNKIRLFMNKN